MAGTVRKLPAICPPLNPNGIGNPESLTLEHFNYKNSLPQLPPNLLTLGLFDLLHAPIHAL
ncbi:MAG: hypothetical protein NT023_16625 [Armatimonadetes bacterium]|nr:hypothetical protein [Armatimonadota bacterium]